jgi:2-methylisocitrate lyase-like PEP mutase family enzyme
MAEKFRRTVTRGNAYREAGADGVFVPDFNDLDKKTIKSLVKEIDAPLNIVAGGEKPTIPELEAAGVARVSFGPRVMRAALALIRKIAREIRSSGTYTSMVADTISYREVNGWFRDYVKGKK